MGMGWCDVGTTCKILYSSMTETAYKQNAMNHDKVNTVGWALSKRGGRVFSFLRGVEEGRCFAVCHYV